MGDDGGEWHFIQHEGAVDFRNLNCLVSRNLTKEEDLTAVTTFEIEPDIRQTSISSLGKSLPNLQRLKLRNGYVPSIRDLGVGYEFLTVLWITRCQLTELDGIGSLGALKELYLSYNEIDDLSSLGMLDCLEILDLEGNNINDIDQIEHLSLCTSLQSLTLEGNPITAVYEEGSIEGERSKHYLRSTVWNCIPHLQSLDDELLNVDEREDFIPDDFRSKLEEVAKSRPPSAFAKKPVSMFDSDIGDASSSLTFGKRIKRAISQLFSLTSNN
ncbi:Leucine-rich repeat-containing protein 56 [Dinochytrium kinnereticum]|nr:Leucine-rich repeat-containing protein 56 [Dinochytrium kinnereticum]